MYVQEIFGKKIVKKKIKINEILRKRNKRSRGLAEGLDTRFDRLPSYIKIIRFMPNSNVAEVTYLKSAVKV